MHFLSDFRFAILLTFSLTFRVNCSDSEQVRIESVHKYGTTSENRQQWYMSMEQFQREWTPQIINLGDYLRNFVASHCLILISTLCRNIPTSALKYSVILRNLVLLTIPSSQNVFWGPETLVSKNLTSSQTAYFKCPFSKFFTPGFLN